MMAENESLAQRYSVVLEELRLEALKQTQQQGGRNRSSGLNMTMHPGSFPPQSLINQANGPNPQDQNGFSQSNELFPSPDGVMFEGPGATTPSSLMAEYVSSVLHYVEICDVLSQVL